MASEAFFVYVHMRPDLTPFYVGKGTKYRAQSLKARNVHHRNVVSKLGRENVLIEMLRCGSEAEALLREQVVIKALLASGVDLTNKTGGGEGVSGLVHSVAARRKIAEAGKGRRLSEETKQLISSRLSGRHLSQEHRDKMSLAWKSRPPMSDVTRAKVSAGLRLRPPPSEETRSKISLAKRGVPRTKQHNEKMSASLAGKALTPEHKANIARALVGRVISAEHREKIRAAAVADWKKRRLSESR